MHMDREINMITRYGAYGIIAEHSKLLLIQKKSGPYKGLWDLPGGAIEFGESPEFTVKREIQEEVALAANNLELVTVMTNHGNYFNDGKQIQIHHIGIIYRVNKVSPLLNVIPEEKEQWFDVRDFISEELTPFAKQVGLKFSRADHENCTATAFFFS